MTETVSDGTDEESMMACIKNFDAEQAKLIKSFVANDLRLPVAMQQKFSGLRSRLASGQVLFKDIPDLQGQLSYLLEVSQDLQIIPQPWLTFGSSVSYMLKKTGRFVENTSAIFESESLLGCFVSLRAKYMVLALKDLTRMKLLKCSAQIEKGVSDMAAKIDGAEPCEADEFSAALAAFDSEACLHHVTVELA